MFAKLLLVLATVCVTIAHAGLPSFGITPGTSTLKSDVKAGQTGLDGLNLQLNAPFKIDDYVVGFRVALKSVLSSKVPLPDSVFLKKSVATPSPLDGTATVDTSVDLATKVLSADATWSAKETDLSLTASANSVDRVTDVGISTRAKVRQYNAPSSLPPSHVLIHNPTHRRSGRRRRASARTSTS